MTEIKNLLQFPWSFFQSISAFCILLFALLSFTTQYLLMKGKKELNSRHQCKKTNYVLGYFELQTLNADLHWFFLLMIYLRVGLYLETVQNNSGLTLGKSVRNVSKCNYMPYMQRWQLTVKVLGMSSTHILYLILFIYTYVNYTFSSSHILHKSFCSLCFWD